MSDIIFIPETETLKVVVYTNGCDDNNSYVYNPDDAENMVYTNNMTYQCLRWNSEKIWEETEDKWNCN